MGFDDWSTVVAPKVQGTWNLHNAISSELDFFILCSSLSGIVGQPGQANYAAANTFLDAFVQYRHRNGLAASAIDIGVMGNIGYAWQNRNAPNTIQKSGLHILKEKDLINTVNLAIQRSKPIQAQTRDGAYSNHGQILLGLLTTVPTSSSNNRLVWKQDVRMSIYYNINGLGEASADVSGKAPPNQDSIAGFMALAATTPAVLEEENSTIIIANAVASALANLLIKDEDNIKIEYSPEKVGVDSLVAMELSNWIRQKFGVEASSMNIAQSASLVSLGDYIRLGLIKRFKL
jgi:acyl carrier protein